MKSEIIARCGLEVSSMIKDNTKILDIGNNIKNTNRIFFKIFIMNIF